MEIRFTNVAESELSEAVAHYNNQEDGLGQQFVAEVKDATARILSFPEAWPRLSARTRRCVIKRFPYSLIYQLREDHVLIVAVMHMRREPQTWRSRLR